MQRSKTSQLLLYKEKEFKNKWGPLYYHTGKKFPCYPAMTIKVSKQVA